MIGDSITILKGKPKVFVNREKNKNTIFFVSPTENSKPPSGGTITNDRCLTHMRDAAHSESTTKSHMNHQTVRFQVKPPSHLNWQLKQEDVALYSI